ncbi:DUF6935 domain-containing protein [Microscilla marina]|nr:hypothetical protein [Microscilla marina]
MKIQTTRHVVLWLVVLMLGSQTSFAQKIVTLNKLPASPEEFIKMRNKMSRSPEGGAAMFLAALLNMGKNEKLGMQCLTIAIDQSQVVSGNVYKGYKPGRSVMYHLNRLKRGGSRGNFWAYAPKAYLKGATLKNGYTPSKPYKVVTSRNKYSGKESSGRVKVFVDVAGFRPRPVTMKRNDKGIWKAHEFSSFFLDVPKATKKKDDL